MPDNKSEGSGDSASAPPQSQEQQTPPQTSSVGETANIGSKRVRLPNFWNSNPMTWFIQAEAQFTVYRITSQENKYCLKVAALPADTCDSVIDILTNPPSTDKYSALKAALIKRHSVSETKRLEALVEKADIGDRKPSEVFRSMKQLAGTSFSDEIIRNLWMRRLPQPINIALLSVGERALDELVGLADKIYEASQNSSIYTISTSQSTSTSNSYSNDIEQRLNKIESMMKSLSLRPRSRRKSSQAIRNRSESRKKSSSNSGNCWFHKRFGNKARNCSRPCSFSCRQNQTNHTSKFSNSDNPN